MKKLIGHCGVDSGQLMIADPCYIAEQWDNTDNFDDTRKLKDIKTGKVYQYRVDFENYDSNLIDGKSVNELVLEKRLVELPNKGTGNFSYGGACGETLSEERAGQLNYKLGHAGAGVVFASGYGDGFYPVYAHYNKEGRIIKVEIIMK